MESKENCDIEIFMSKSDPAQKIVDLLSILSKPDAIRIFTLAKNGIKSGLDTPSEIGLTKKQYYSRLGQLVKLGLLIKRGDAYGHTMFGEIIYHNYLLRLGKEIKNSRYMLMFDIIKQSRRFSKDEIELFSSKIRSEGAFDNV